MLSPEARLVAVDLLRPPVGYRLDQAVLTTFSLDLEALLALPLAALAHSDSGVDELMADPLLLLEALRESGDRIHVFVDEAAIAIPRTGRGIYAMLEASVHPVRAPNGGVFHPKGWFVRFLDEDNDTSLVRVAVLSRNLTFDRSWDVALTSEATPSGQRRKAASRPLGDFLRALPEMATQAIPEQLTTEIEQLASEAERCALPAPEPCYDPIEFQTLGLKRSRRPRMWQPDEDSSRLLAISPFLSIRAIEGLAETSSGERTLIGRQDELDRLPEGTLADWDRVFVLAEHAGTEIDDEAADRPDGLHAKLVGLEHGWDVTWYVGSANATYAAYGSQNVELMASVTGRRSRVGIERFAEAGFMSMCEPYRRIEPTERDSEVDAAEEALEAARKELLSEGALHVECSREESDCVLTLAGDVALPAGIDVVAWPLSLDEGQGKPLPLPLTWRLPTNLLTAFIGFRLSVPGVEVDDVRLALLLPATGMPENRMMHVLRSLIDSPERFMRFLRALLGGLDSLVDWAGREGNGSEPFAWGAGLGGESLLEDLMRIAARQPARLEPVRRLVEDLRATEEGRRIVPDDLLAVWDAVNEAVGLDRIGEQDARGTSIERNAPDAAKR